MLVAAYFCEKDYQIALKNLEWCIEMEKTTPYECLLACDSDTPQEAFQKMQELAGRYFSAVHHLIHSPPPEKSWPMGPNYAWQSVAWHIGSEFKTHWFWWEADVVPLRKGWLQLLDEEYKRGQRPFAGYIVRGVVPSGHMNGVGIYPPKVSAYCPQAFLAQRMAWDVASGKYIVPQGLVHHIGNLYQHCWALKDCKECVNDSSFPSPSFSSWEQIEKVVDFRCAIFHRCKDGSLIDQIRKHHGSLDMTTANVPKHTDGQKTTIEIIESQLPVYPENPKTEILIITYKKDARWLDYCLQSLAKFASGFHKITVAAPYRDESVFKKMQRKHGFNLYQYAEVPGKGMVQHEERICSADEICTEADFIMHLDADCIYHSRVTPDEYVVKNKPVYVVRTYESLFSPDRKSVSDCFQWKAVAANTLGFEPEMYTMCRHPTVLPKWMYSKFRAHVESVQKMPFREFVLLQKNEFPQTFAEFPSLGAYAWKFHRNAFHWIDISETGSAGAPKDLQKAYWSHGGLAQKMESGKTAEEEIIEFLK